MQPSQAVPGHVMQEDGSQYIIVFCTSFEAGCRIELKLEA